MNWSYNFNNGHIWCNELDSEEREFELEHNFNTGRTTTFQWPDKSNGVIYLANNWSPT